MDEFSYYNMFDTKGIEYILVISFLLLLIPFWLLLNRQARVTRRIEKVLGALSASILAIPQGLLYSRSHTWTFLEKNGNAKVGLDDFLVHVTGKVNVKYRTLPGATVRKGDIIAEIEHGGKSLEVRSPVSGIVQKQNRDILLNQELLHNDPCGKGWLLALKPVSWMSEVMELRMAEDATEWFGKEVNHYKEFMAVNLAKSAHGTEYAVLQDGGEIAVNALADMPGELWTAFQSEFLAP